jgi:23S rRNA (guanosine2251-2'-O)-methyltransferase
MAADIIEGRNPVIEALKSDRPIDKILLAQNIERHVGVAQILHLSQARGIPIEYVARHVIDKSSTTAAHQGVIAYAAVKEYVTLEDLLTISRKRNEAPLYCILDGIEDPHNMGAILRTADASGIHGVIVRSRRALAEAKILIEQWRKEYNQIRPHSALRYRPPAPEAIMPVIMSMRLT